MHTLAALVAVVTTAVAAGPGQGPPGRAGDKPRVLVLDLEASDVAPAQVKLIDGLVTESMSRFDGFDVVSSADLRQLSWAPPAPMLVSVEAERSAAGCDASSCLAEVAGALGARFVVFGNVGKLGTLTVMTVSLFDSEKAAAVARQRIQVQRVEELPGALDKALVALIGRPQRASPGSPSPQPPPLLPGLPPVPALAVQWTTNAVQWRGQNGKIVVVDCPPGNTGTVYGGPVYTDDSSLCAAAVHAGAIARNGGRVTLQIAPGQPSYAASTSNGITSASWGQWHGSFVVTAGAPAAPSDAPPGPMAIAWTTTATTWRGQHGARIEVACPPGGVVGVVYGGDPTYTDDSSICTAAVHAGRISLAAGGVVVIEMAPGRPSFSSTSAHGVTTRPWHQKWDGAYWVR